MSGEDRLGNVAENMRGNIGMTSSSSAAFTVVEWRSLYETDDDMAAKKARFREHLHSCFGITNEHHASLLWDTGKIVFDALATKDRIAVLTRQVADARSVQGSLVAQASSLIATTRSELASFNRAAVESQISELELDLASLDDSSDSERRTTVLTRCRALISHDVALLRLQLRLQPLLERIALDYEAALSDPSALVNQARQGIEMKLEEIRSTLSDDREACLRVLEYLSTMLSELEACQAQQQRAQQQQAQQRQAQQRQAQQRQAQQQQAQQQQAQQQRAQQQQAQQQRAQQQQAQQQRAQQQQAQKRRGQQRRLQVSPQPRIRGISAARVYKVPDGQQFTSLAEAAERVTATQRDKQNQRRREAEEIARRRNSEAQTLQTAQQNKERAQRLHQRLKETFRATQVIRHNDFQARVREAAEQERRVREQERRVREQERRFCMELQALATDGDADADVEALRHYSGYVPLELVGLIARESSDDDCDDLDV